MKKTMKRLPGIHTVITTLLIAGSVSPNVLAEETEDLVGQREALDITETHPHFGAIRDALEAEIVRIVGEPVNLQVWVSVLDDWAKVCGNITTRSGREIANEDAQYYTEGDLTALLKKVDGRWEILYHVVAGDITAAIEVPRQFPDVPEALFPRLPPEVTGEAPVHPVDSEERMAFIDGGSNFRTGPTTRSQVKFQPREGTAGTVIGREGNWIMIELDNGDSGWAHKQNLRPVGSGAQGTPALPQQQGPWIFPDSSQRRLTSSELQNLGKDELWRARNEIFARNGLIFSSQRGRAFANSLGNAYSGTDSDANRVSGRLNQVEKANVEAIRKYE